MFYFFVAFTWPVPAILLTFAVYRKLPIWITVAMVMMFAAGTAFFMSEWAALWSATGYLAQLFVILFCCRRFNFYFDRARSLETYDSEPNDS